MGEKIQDLRTVRVGPATFDVELNRGVVSTKRLVHLQSDSVRIDMSEDEFIRHAVAIIAAADRLRRVKDPAAG